MIEAKETDEKESVEMRKTWERSGRGCRGHRKRGGGGGGVF